MELTSLPVARYRLIFQITQAISLPEYAGSTLRGAFGRALRKISCMTKQEDCKNCPLYRSCPYTQIFETPPPAEHQLQKFSQVPNGYVIEPPQWGEKQYLAGEQLSFELVLFGRLLHQLPLITFAFKRAFEYQVGKGKAILLDLQLFDEKSPLGYYSILEKGNIIDHPNSLHIPAHLPSEMELDIQTPLRIQENGQPLRPNAIKIERLLLGLAKRIALLHEFHHQPLALDFELLRSQLSNIKDQKILHWQDWTRYSSRQDQRMKLGGVIGKWQLNGISEEWQRLLYIGQWLHTGKNATFGLGKYRITNL
ncbi:CRISPR system precrRNA processing endoribonuclease RAMP protein Cas6 [Conservatibacter flavescens]|uniref:CRISPR-associated protein Cas6 n=1 Tax=Conservatibacter flavescens TaxID=28161 RepID=A0A2M8S390_9PAST|nr:CRISPR system precrRNA processing endoribonuclease RAMP protein Cas6 [Conservatibacter flavescens]PJG85619.1 CRISPR-associated protein Cas6 [Conservatibacter flavescens]